MTRFIADRAKEAQASYVLIGASALIIRGIIERETKVGPLPSLCACVL